MFSSQIRRTMNVVKIIERFPDEHTCREDLKMKRENDGIHCDRCGSLRLNWLENRSQWHCKDCKTRKTLRSGSIMQDSKLPVRTWYLCMAMMTMSKKPMSAHEMQRQLGFKRYEPIWAMMHKIRKAMAQRDALYTLEGEVELDEGHFAVPVKSGTRLKCGLGSERRRPVAVMAETALLENHQTGERYSQCRYFKMKVLEKSSSKEINETVDESLDERTIVLSDKSNRYLDISDIVEGHVTCYSDKESTNTTLKWVHIAISNAKRTLLGIYHCIKGKNLQAYLDEFCYKLNRRYFGNGLFDRLLLAVASSRCIQTD